jgi:hypothetical protein
VRKEEGFQGGGENRRAASEPFVKPVDKNKAPAEARGF